jgi:hypothetical protein
MNVLTIDQVEDVSAGVNWGAISAGVGIVALGLSIAATGGLAGIAIGVIAGAGTLGELGLAGVALGLSGVGGVAIGAGLQN